LDLYLIICDARGGLDRKKIISYLEKYSILFHHFLDFGLFDHEKYDSGSKKNPS
jgi:hypothetical protein